LKEAGSTSTFFNTSESLPNPQFYSQEFYQDSFYASTETVSPTDEFDQPTYANTASRGFSSILYNSDQLLSKGPYINEISKGLGSIAIDVNTSFESLPYSSSFPFSSPSLNGMDQNPPCNTLYVGNLPNETTEEELYILFCQSPGYKRLSLKIRNTGPMCFVEVFLILI
jgi:hypothetical protein